MTRRAFVPADLAPLSGCAAELAEAFVSLANDIALVIDENGVICSVAQGAGAPIAALRGRSPGRALVPRAPGPAGERTYLKKPEKTL